MTGLEGCVSQVNAMFLEQAVLFRLEEYLEQLAKTESEKFVPEEDVLLTAEAIEKYIDSIVVSNEEEIEIRWKV